MSDLRWGFMVGATFIEVPKGPLIAAHLQPPCTVKVGTAERHIIVAPRSFAVAIRPSQHGHMLTVSRTGPHWMAFAYEAPTEAAARAEADRVIADVLARDQERIARHG